MSGTGISVQTLTFYYFVSYARNVPEVINDGDTALSLWQPLCVYEAVQSTHMFAGVLLPQDYKLTEKN
jgi:hypothetical protein